MTFQQLWLVGVYCIAAALILPVVLASRRRPGPANLDGASAGDKLTGFLTLNLVMLALALAPKWTFGLPLAVGVILAAAFWELAQLPRRVLSGVVLMATCVTLGAMALARLWWLDTYGVWTAATYLAAAAGDAYGQVVGQALGSRRLAPRISPGKTVEGAVAGLAAASVMCGAIGVVLPIGADGGAAAGAAMAAAGLAGDLGASALKRAAGVATYGRLMGASGGVLDRFDSLLLGAAFVGLATL